MKGLSNIILGFLLFLSLNIGLVFAQETPTPQEPIQSTNESEVQWVWGEVVSVDPANKIIIIKYLDYETDKEKEITVNVDDKTTYENIKSIDEIKPKDTLSLDYTVSPDAKNVAKNISVEKPEVEQGLEEGLTPEKSETAPKETPESTSQPTTE